jgi:4a-hydroxytetrahydrobiopterin dehydratase
MDNLSKKHCLPCEGGVPALEAETLKNYLKQLGKEWQLSADGKLIFKDFQFKNYYQTMAFVNAIAWMAHRENHHPDLVVGYNHCLVQYTTHAAHGVTENDFICAQKV